MPTSFPMPIPHAPSGFVNQAALDAAFTIPINDVAAQVAVLQPRLQVTQVTTGQAMTNGAFTTITGYATADVDTFGGSTFNTATGIWTCPAAGQYEISGQVTVTSGGTRLIVGLRKNGAATMFHGAYQPGSSVTQITGLILPKEFTLAQNDTIDLAAQVNTTSITTLSNNGNNPYLRIKRVG